MSSEFVTPEYWVYYPEIRVILPRNTGYIPPEYRVDYPGKVSGHLRILQNKGRPEQDVYDITF